MTAALSKIYSAVFMTVKLVITSGDGKNSVEIGLYLDVHVTGIELDKEGIIF